LDIIKLKKIKNLETWTFSQKYRENLDGGELGAGVGSYLPPPWNQRNPVIEVKKHQPLTFGDDFQAPSALSASKSISTAHLQTLLFLKSCSRIA
jgi:hypothetical protein